MLVSAGACKALELANHRSSEDAEPQSPTGSGVTLHTDCSSWYHAGFEGMGETKQEGSTFDQKIPFVSLHYLHITGGKELNVLLAFLK